MGEKFENAAEILGYIVLSIFALLAVLLAMVIFGWIARIYNRYKYESLKRQNAEYEWDQIYKSWVHEDRQDEDRNVSGADFEDVPDPDRHDTLDLSDIPEQLYNYQEEQYYEGR